MIPASKGRLFGVTVVVAALIATLGVRLWYVQVKEHPGYVALANQDRIREIVEPPVRGEIVADNGQPLVYNTSSLTVAVNMATIDTEANGQAELDRLATLLGMSDKTLQEKVRICTVGVSQPCWPGSPYQPIPVAEHVPDQVALQVLESKSEFPGVTADVQPQTTYAQPIGTDMSQVLGYLQPITEQEVQQLKIPVTGFSADDLIGQAGLEYQYDSQLRGTSGIDEVEVNASGQVTSTIKNDKPVAGDDLITSINPQLQVDTEDILANAVQGAEIANPGATSGAAVVETTTGRIVAMASYPTYNPDIWNGGISEAEFNRLFGTGDSEPILNRVTQGEYYPGSTWKVTTLAAAVGDGYPLYGTYDCPASVTVGGESFANDGSPSLGPMSLSEALIVSCDTVFYELAEGMWQSDHPALDNVTRPDEPVQKMQKMELDWGFGVNPGIDLPEQSPGDVPTRDWLYWFWKDNAYAGQEWCKFGKQFGNEVQQIEWHDCYYGNQWSEGQAVIAAIGQGLVSVTPLQLANAYTALADGGTLYSPRVGEEVLSPTGQVVETINPPVVRHLPVASSTLAYIRTALQGVVTQGTAAGAFGGFPLGKVCVAGKTGTAQVLGKLSTSVFASFAPCNDPKFVVVVMIPDSGYGADFSAPAVRKIWEALYGLDGQKAALPNGQLPTLPHMNSAGQIVDGS
ncbi:MAG TPA: penicillin-binding protein 2 [Streptosporangiaceae bacterium]|nr:penicillin-binding protein 2 [Streptosporangiaceae bacterium]